MQGTVVHMLMDFFKVFKIPHCCCCAPAFSRPPGNIMPGYAGWQRMRKAALQSTLNRGWLCCAQSANRTVLLQLTRILKATREHHARLRGVAMDAEGSFAVHVE